MKRLRLHLLGALAIAALGGCQAPPAQPPRGLVDRTVSKAPALQAQRNPNAGSTPGPQDDPRALAKPDPPATANAALPLVDAERMARVPVVLRVLRLTKGSGDKYAWVRVRILDVLKNASGSELGAEIEVAYYSWKPGVPEGESTLYLEPYSETPQHAWKLLGSSAEQGVSHATKGRRP